jgi:hypothetical protein
MGVQLATRILYGHWKRAARGERAGVGVISRALRVPRRYVQISCSVRAAPREPSAVVPSPGELKALLPVALLNKTSVPVVDVS